MSCSDWLTNDGRSRQEVTLRCPEGHEWEAKVTIAYGVVDEEVSCPECSLLLSLESQLRSARAQADQWALERIAHAVDEAYRHDYRESN